MSPSNEQPNRSLFHPISPQLPRLHTPRCLSFTAFFITHFPSSSSMLCLTFIILPYQTPKLPRLLLMWSTLSPSLLCLVLLLHSIPLPLPRSQSLISSFRHFVMSFTAAQSSLSTSGRLMIMRNVSPLETPTLAYSTEHRQRCRRVMLTLGLYRRRTTLTTTIIHL